jgi:DNA ligase 1
MSDLFSLPLLYKKTSTGAIQYWKICVYEDSNSGSAHTIETEYGQVGTESPQVTFDTISKGKNVGKKNETTPKQQAEAEATAKWEKQKKKGYVESIEAAQAGEVDALIEGGISPMLAHKYSEHGSKIIFPAYVQPKLDGIRCIAILKSGKCTLWSRTRKPITSMPHIIAEIEAMNIEDCVLDGELYNHDYKNNFETIVSKVRQEEPDPEHKIVQYHIYDCIHTYDFEGRYVWMVKSWNSLHAKPPEFLKLVETHKVEDEGSAIEYFKTFKNLGYEGAMLRNSMGLYVNKRSHDLQKVKEFDDSEFPIVGVDEGRGKLAGHVGAFICRTPDGKIFLAKMSGDTGKLKEYFENHSLWTGKLLTVQYQGFTGKEGVPRFPVGISIRDYE